MIDTLIFNKAKAEKSDVLARLELQVGQYAVITLHRPSNVDNPENIRAILDAFEEIQKELKLVFPIHPRTRNNLMALGFHEQIRRMPNLILLEPVGYLDFLCLTSKAALVVTDSGGIQEETTILQVPCMTLRENTERPVTISEGTNRLVHVATREILRNYRDMCSGINGRPGHSPKLWDGQAAGRIVQILEKHI